MRHLCGTFDVLTAWLQPDRVRLAGVLHNAYATDAFAHALFDLTADEIALLEANV